jgi:malate dehydrogenase
VRIKFNSSTRVKLTTFSSFAEKVIRAVKGETGIIEPSFVYLPGVEGGPEIQKITGCDFFSVPVELGVSLTRHSCQNVPLANMYP